MEQSETAPSLSELAQVAGLSPSHFHRVFKAATGVTPKAYAAAHRTRRTQSALQTGTSVTEAIYEAGFGSSGRFYENADAALGMTPTAFRQGGAGTEIRFAIGQCSLGAILVGQTNRGVCAILLGDDPGALIQDLEHCFPQATLIGGDAEYERTVAVVVGLMETPNKNLDLPLDIRGTAFQQRVWDALRQIPVGTTTTYAEIARRLGTPQAARAVARAIGANPLAVAIPCHRVVRTDGSLGGYRWGLARKQTLLARENPPERTAKP